MMYSKLVKWFAPKVTVEQGPNSLQVVCSDWRMPAPDYLEGLVSASPSVRDKVWPVLSQVLLQGGLPHDNGVLRAFNQGAAVALGESGMQFLKEPQNYAFKQVSDRVTRLTIAGKTLDLDTMVLGEALAAAAKRGLSVNNSILCIALARESGHSNLLAGLEVPMKKRLNDGMFELLDSVKEVVDRYNSSVREGYAGFKSGGKLWVRDDVEKFDKETTKTVRLLRAFSEGKSPQLALWSSVSDR